MLRLKANPTFKAPVKIPVPGEQEIVIMMEFKHMTKDAYAAFIDKEKTFPVPRTDEEAIMDIAVGWDQVDAEFNRENLKELCQQYHRAGSTIVQAFIDELTQFRRGN